MLSTSVPIVSLNSLQSLTITYYIAMTFLNTLLLFTVLALAHSQMYSMTPPYQQHQQCRLITVSGAGKASAVPDTAILNIGVSALANTSVSALSQMNTKARQLLTILSQYNIPTANIQTSSLSLQPQYNYTNGTQQLLGQMSSQTFSVKIFNIGNGSIVGSIVDAATNIQNITVSGLSFDIRNKTSLSGTSNKNAWDDAYDKATQQANLTGVQLGKVNRIDVQGEPQVFRQSYNQLVGAATQGTPTQVSVGTYAVTSDIVVSFLIS